MKATRILSKFFLLVLTLAVVGIVPTLAQSSTPLTVSLPSIWQDVLTPDVLAEFEAQHPGVKVYVKFDNTNFFGFGGGSATIDTQLDDTEAAVTAADVLYIDPSSLSVADTQAGYYLNLNPLVMNDPGMNVSDFVPAAWQSYQWDNGMWALPLSVDVVLVTYDPVAFDEAGLAYPNERWTIDDFANAATRLTTYNADGTVETPGFSATAGGNNQDLFLRTLIGTSFYDAATLPNAPSFANATAEYVLGVWRDMLADGVVQTQGGGGGNQTPLRVSGINGYAGGFGGGNPNNQQTRYATLMPGGVAGLSTQGFAVSAGTQSPELAYELAKFLTLRPELASNVFSVAPARYSLVGTQPTNTNGNNPGGGPGGGGIRGLLGNRSIPADIQPTVDQGLTVALPVSELRYTSYLTSVMNDINNNGTDPLVALQTAEAQAISDMQTAIARQSTLRLFVAPPPAEVVLAPGEITLTCGVNEGFARGFGGNNQLPNQDEWDAVIAAFVASDPVVGAVTVERTQETDLATLVGQYDCFILNSNAVPGNDVSMLLSLDPLLDTDPSFDRNDVIGNTMSQLQQDNKTWALPLALQPQMLSYNPELLAQAGVPEPINGWTVASFYDALRMLKPFDTDPIPFVPNDPSGSYLLMLIGAYGGLPLDYRTDPPAVNFTDPVTVDAIRQVLDLISAGYIDYSPLGQGGAAFANNNSSGAITTNSLSQFNFGPGNPNANANRITRVQTTYPQGTQYSVVAYEITTGYISGTVQNPEAAYRFMSAVASSPQLFSGMPARRSLVNDPAVVAAQGPEVTAVYQQLDTLLRAPNAIAYPTFTNGRGGITSIIQSYWLQQAFDRYLNEGADLELELADAQTITLAYQECIQSLVVEDTTASGLNAQLQVFQQIAQCATRVDPTLTFGQ